MRTYDCCCRYCGHLNRRLYLEETEGWMECELCGRDSRDTRFVSMKVLPTYHVAVIRK